MKNPKEKGNSHERKVANILTEWSGSKFMRTPMSGAIHNFKDKRVVSDIVAPLSIENWPFSIECKNTENSWEINTFIEGTAVFWKQCEQCYDDSQRESLIPMLVFTKNYRDIYMAIEMSVFLKTQVSLENYAVVVRKDVELVVVKFTEFLSKITVDELTKRLKPLI